MRFFWEGRIHLGDADCDARNLEFSPDCLVEDNWRSAPLGLDISLHFGLADYFLL
jgi:hypothetical protein